MQCNSITRGKKILFLTISILFLTGFLLIPAASADTIVAHANVTGNLGKFQSSIYIWQCEDAVGNKDFYAIRVFTWSPYLFGNIKVNVKFTQSGAVDYWAPPQGWYPFPMPFTFTFFQVGFGFYTYGTIYYTGQFTNDFTQIQSGFSLFNHEVGMGLWVPDDAGLDVTITIKVGWPRPGPPHGPLFWETASKTFHIDDLWPE